MVISSTMVAFTFILSLNYSTAIISSVKKTYSLDVNNGRLWHTERFWFGLKRWRRELKPQSGVFLGWPAVKQWWTVSVWGRMRAPGARDQMWQEPKLSPRNTNTSPESTHTLHISHYRQCFCFFCILIFLLELNIFKISFQLMTSKNNIFIIILTVKCLYIMMVFIAMPSTFAYLN